MDQKNQEKLTNLRLQYLQHPERRGEFLLAYYQDRIVGTASLHCKTNGIAHLAEGYVHPDFRGLGIYRSLISYRLKQIQSQGYKLVVTQANPDTSVPILKRMGFQKQCIIKDYM